MGRRSLFRRGKRGLGRARMFPKGDRKALWSRHRPEERKRPWQGGGTCLALLSSRRKEQRGLGAVKLNMRRSHPQFGNVAGTQTLSPLCASLELRTASSATGGAVLRSPQPPWHSMLIGYIGESPPNTASQGRCSHSIGASKLASATRPLFGLD